MVRSWKHATGEDLNVVEAAKVDERLDVDERSPISQVLQTREALFLEDRFGAAAELFEPAIEASAVLGPAAQAAQAAGLVAAATANIDLSKDPLGEGSDGNPVYLKDIWPASAELAYRGFSAARRLAPNGPHGLDYALVSAEPRWLPLPGRYTRYGDVRELLEEPDDRTVILAAGDELALRFDAMALPPPPAGWRRTVFLESHGWDKDAEPDKEIQFTPARVIMQDFTGVPCIVDLATMREAMAELEPLEAKVLYLHFAHGLTLPRITEMLGLENRSGAKAFIARVRSPPKAVAPTTPMPSPHAVLWLTVLPTSTMLTSKLPAPLVWLGGHEMFASQLVLDHLLPLAHEGLSSVGVEVSW